MPHIYTWRQAAAPLAVIGGAFVAGLSAYPYLPARVPIHWGPSGAVDGWSSAGFAVASLPIFALALFGLLAFIPLVDARRDAVMSFAPAYRMFVLTFVVFMAWMHALVLAAGLWDFSAVAPGALIGIAGLFRAMAILMPQTARNNCIGFRLPWTLASDESWKQTHELAAKWFNRLALVTVILAVLPFGAWTFVAFMTALVAVAVGVSWRSYRLSKRNVPHDGDAK